MDKETRDALTMYLNTAIIQTLFAEQAPQDRVPLCLIRPRSSTGTVRFSRKDGSQGSAEFDYYNLAAFVTHEASGDPYGAYLTFAQSLVQRRDSDTPPAPLNELKVHNPDDADVSDRPAGQVS